MVLFIYQDGENLIIYLVVKQNLNQSQVGNGKKYNINLLGL